MTVVQNHGVLGRRISIDFSQKPIHISVDTLPSSSTSQKPNEEAAGSTEKSPAQAIVDVIKLGESEIVKPELSAPLLGKNYTLSSFIVYKF